MTSSEKAASARNHPLNDAKVFLPYEIQPSIFGVLLRVWRTNLFPKTSSGSGELTENAA